MKALLTILILVAASAVAQAQQFVAPSALHQDTAKTPHFWTLETNINTGILAGLVAADAVTTQRGLSNGFREANPLMRPFVTRGTAGQAAGSALGFGAALGTVCLLHQATHR